MLKENGHTKFIHSQILDVVNNKLTHTKPDQAKLLSLIRGDHWVLSQSTNPIIAIFKVTDNSMKETFGRPLNWYFPEIASQLCSLVDCCFSS